MEKLMYFVFLLSISSSLSDLPREVCFYHKISEAEDYVQCGDSRAFRNPQDIKDDLSHIHKVQIGWNTTLPVVDFGLFTWFPNLASLSLNNLNIESVKSSAFYDMGQLKELSIYNNKLAEIESGTFNQLQQLEILDLGTNKITSLKDNVFSGLISLQHLSVSWNNLEHISKGVFTGLKRLRKLNLAGNKLRTLKEDVFQNLPLLRSLDLSYNGLTEISENVFSEQVNLEILHLDSNSLQVLPEKLFESTVELQILDISNNLLRHIDGYMLNNTVVEVFRFDRNKISMFDAYEFLSSALWIEEVAFDHNPWDCDSLITTVEEFERSQIHYEPGTRFDVTPNVKGILCDIQ